MEQSINIEYGYKTQGGSTTWVFWHDDKRCRFPSFKFEINHKTGKVHFIEGRFNELIGWKHRNKILDILKIDWLYKAIKRPDLVVKMDLFSAIILKKITKPKDFATFILDKYYLNEVISPNLFHKEILAKDVLFDFGDLPIYADLLRVADNTQKAIENIVDLKYRFINNDNFNYLVNAALDSGEKFNLFWSNSRLEEEMEYLINIWDNGFNQVHSSIYSHDYFYKYVSNGSTNKRNIEIKYVGNIILPNNCKLIDNSRELFKEGKKMSHCVASYWDEVMHRKSFIIHMESPQKATFGISRNDSGWFYLFESAGFENKDIEESVMQLIKKYISKMQNQLFFFKNSCFTDNKRHHFLSDPTLYDEVFEPELFKYKMINGILT